MHYPTSIRAVLDRMQAESARVDSETSDHWIRARSLHPDSAALLYLLACSAKAKSILEIGTSVGFSTIHLALAARRTNGHVTTIELLPAKYNQAQANLQHSGLSDEVTQLLGDARVLLPGLAGPWDLVFVDAEKDVYLECWDLFKAKVGIGGLVVADNAVSHADDLRTYQDTIKADPSYDTVTVPIGSGFEISCRR